jgi:hypothetical protein
MRTTLLLLACVATAAGCDGLLGISQHTLADAGQQGDGGEGNDAESGVTVSPGADGGAHTDASGVGEQ